MSDLFLHTELGNVPLSPETVRKYNLKKGDKSPFSNHRIVDRFGDSQTEQPKVAPVPDENPQLMTTSEILDFMQGVDSSDA